MSTHIEQARQAFLGGIEAFEQGRFEPAEQAFALALQLAPGRPSVLLNLGVTKVRLGRFAEAIPLLQQTLAADDNQSDAWAALGLAQMELGRWALALQSHQRAIALGAGSALIQLRLGQCLASQGRQDEAMAGFRAALELDPALAEAWSQQGHVQRETNRLSDAAFSYRQALALGADPELHHYYLAALPSGAPMVDAPKAYVEALFDQYAADFDAHLVTQLGYQGHQVLVERLPEACPRHLDQVLDLGCGTGLCGALVRRRSATLTGVDLSAAMVEKARQRGVYDHLVQADLLDYLSQDRPPIDLVLAADVFIYVGRLDAVFALLAQRMRQHAWLAFTVEDAGNGQDVQLHPSLRYAHSRRYIDTLAAAHGFEVMATHDAALRREQAGAVTGRYLYLRKG